MRDISSSLPGKFSPCSREAGMVSMVTWNDCHAPGSPESGVAAGVGLGKWKMWDVFILESIC